MIKFTRVSTEKHFQFMLSLVDSNKYIIMDAPYFQIDRSMWDKLPEVLEHIILGISFGQGVNKKTDYKFYYFNYNSGLYELDVYLERKITRDMPPWTIAQPIKHKLIAKDLKAFEVLYGQT